MVKGWNELNWSGGKNWFYFGTDGIMKTGWQKLDWTGGNHWFYFDKTDGYMVTGWQQLSWSGGKSWFYFQPTHGYLIQNQCMTIDNKNYCFNNDGVCTTGC
jgi:glucan-binding YG repeat protein